jgi:histidinol dehydrogenase
MGVKIIKTSDRSFQPTLKKILQRRGTRESKVTQVVGDIIRSVRQGGDRALLRHTRLFDRIRLSPRTLEVKQREIDQAMAKVPKNDLRVLRLAAKRIAAFHRRRMERSWAYKDSLGLYLGQKITPLERVGVYVPGGKASYPSTVLMNVVPAKVAGVREIVMASPIGEGSAAVLAAARIAGVDRIFRIGGAQAIAAMAFGTKTVPRVDKIVGPGNIYVAAAKRLVFGEVDIDSIAGPSEILLLVDGRANPAYVAADMLSQAEHDELAAALCVTTSFVLAKKVKAELERRLKETKRRAITRKALERYGVIFVAQGMGEGIRLANEIAPEHIELMVRQPHRWARLIRNAGAIFLGPYSTPPLGDYLAGPNHVLPTGGSARFFSPLGTYDFLKRTSMIGAGKKALRSLGPEIVRLARLEGLDDHARAVEARINY